MIQNQYMHSNNIRILVTYTNSRLTLTIFVEFNTENKSQLYSEARLFLVNLMLDRFMFPTFK